MDYLSGLMGYYCGKKEFYSILDYFNEIFHLKFRRK
jgi:hypothetical protein